MAGLPFTDVNVIICASCGDKGIAFLQGKGKIGVRYKEKPTACLPASNIHDLTINGEPFHVVLNGETATVNGTVYQIAETGALSTASEKEASHMSNKTGADAHGAASLKAGTPGTITKILVQEGQTVNSETDVCVIEVMKMETFVKAGRVGKVGRIYVSTGTTVTAGQVLMDIIG